MRFVILSLFLSTSIVSSAQLHIGSGAQFQISGNAQLTLQDMNLVNNGNFSTGNSIVRFTGSANSSISGTATTQFNIIQINKNAGRNLLFQRPVVVNNELQFVQGLIDLNGYNLELGNTGLLVGESDASHILGATGGEVLFNSLLNAPSGANPGNLGIEITSSQNLGNVVIKRGHKSRVNGYGAGSSILRYYDILPANNTGLNATLRFRYFDSELNGLEENNLIFQKSTNQVTWTNEGYTSRDLIGNFVEKNNIPSFSTWTLSTPGNALPVIFTSFNLRCEAGKIILNWKTAQEFNSSHFVIERNNGTVWTGIGQLPAAGNSNDELSYEFIDKAPVETAQYRIVQHDFDGRFKYTPVMNADCAAAVALLAWPNPFLHAFTVKIYTSRSGLATIRVVDVNGRLVITNQQMLQRGANQFDLNLEHATSGVYLLTVEWADGMHLETIRLIKQ